MKYIKKLFSMHIIRYGMVGGIGIPVNLIALAIFIHFFGQNGLAKPLSIIVTFEISTTINFILNQTFTYHEQKLFGRSEWLKRAAKAQVTSLSTQIITLVLAYAIRDINPYAANMLGIVFGFFFQFFVTKRFVFRPVETPSAPPHEQLMLSDEAPMTSK